jgi:hypothetical protein
MVTAGASKRLLTHAIRSRGSGQDDAASTDRAIGSFINAEKRIARSSNVPGL